MDRSYLSDARVVEASRDFVCIRLATYEDQAEADFLKSLYVGRSGEMENTTFAILSPDGKRKLAAAGRGPFHAFRNAANMAAGMKQIAKRFAASSQGEQQLPLMKNLDLALNVAAADSLPLLVTVSDDPRELREINHSLVSTAWSEPLLGQFVYASVRDRGELKPLTGVNGDAQILLVEPGQFGLAGETVAQFKADDQRSLIAKKMRMVATSRTPQDKSHNSHVRLGLDLGIEWKSLLPETDPMSIRAKARVRNGRQ